MANKPPVVTIDGPSGSGKGTLAGLLAESLGWQLLDSGAIYRIVGVMAVRERISMEENAVAQFAADLLIDFSSGRVFVTPRGGEQLDLTDEIRSEDAGAHASVVAAMPKVRQAVLKLQRDARKAPGLVADGRDMGSNVFPDAQVKIFLDASAEERAQRRYKQLKNKGLSVSLRGLLEQIEERDARDRERTTAPLKPADDALIIDSTSMSIEAVFDLVQKEVKKRLRKAV